jgi:hypothetical protein
MKPFFAGGQPEKAVTHGEATFELPILYFRDDAFGLYFTADADAVRAQMPSDRLYPVVLPNNKAIAAIFAFNYINTSIGPYGEVAVALPAVYGQPVSPFRGILPALMESRYPGFGVVVMHLPVTRVEARDAGRGEWGYTKFIADMRFDITPEFMQCRMWEGEDHILDLRVRRRGFYLRDSKPLTTYSVLRGDLIKTVIPQQATKRLSPFTGGSELVLGGHPVSATIRELDLKPLMSVYYTERPAILPSGRVIAKGVRPLEGYLGSDRVAQHRVFYPGQVAEEPGAPG